MTKLALIGLWAALSGCSGESEPAVDLPADWKSAQRIASFEQSACSGSPYEGPAESIEAVAGTKSIHATIHRAHFRCDQPVEGYSRRSVGLLDVLVQPVEMSPETVVKCDCLYELDMTLPVAAGSYELTVYRRWDHLSGNDEPRFIGTASVDVE